MFNLLTGRDVPMLFSDWCARIERILERHEQRVTLDRSSDLLKSCYDVGLSPQEIADTWREFS